MEIQGVSCYGKIEENSNFELIFEDEEKDFIWIDGNPESKKPFRDWDEVVSFFLLYDKSIVQIEAV